MHAVLTSLLLIYRALHGLLHQFTSSPNARSYAVDARLLVILLSKKKSTGDSALCIWNKTPYQTRLISTPSPFHLLCVSVVYRCKGSQLVTWQLALRFICLAQGHLNPSQSAESVCLGPFSQATGEFYPATFCLVTGSVIRSCVCSDCCYSLPSQEISLTSALAKCIQFCKQIKWDVLQEE